MAFHRLDFDAGNFDTDSPGRGADLRRRNALGHQPCLDFATADNRTAIVQSDFVGIAEMIECSVGDNHKVDAGKSLRLQG